MLIFSNVEPILPFRLLLSVKFTVPTLLDAAKILALTAPVPTVKVDPEFRVTEDDVKELLKLEVFSVALLPSVIEESEFVEPILVEVVTVWLLFI